MSLQNNTSNEKRESLSPEEEIAMTPTDNNLDCTAVDYTFFRSRMFWVVFLAMNLNVVAFALDQFIVTVAVPQIVSRFNALDKIEWLNTAFFIPCAGGILVYSQIMTVCSPRWVYISALIIFEAGSAICGAAQSMNMLIVGRAVAGLGGAGMWNATYLIAGDLIPFEKRPGLYGLFGMSYMLASIMGPLVGGAFTDMGTSGWRWCFYVNLPIGGTTLLLFLLTLPSTPLMPAIDGKIDDRPKWLKIMCIDWVSAVLSLAFVTCLGVGLQWGGVSKKWSDARVIVMLALALATLVSLCVWSVIMGSKAMIPFPLLRSRHFFAGLWISFFGYSIVVCFLYYLSIYFEAIKGKSAIRAGVLLLGLQLSMSPVLVIAGKTAERFGHAKIPMLVGSALCATASGLFSAIGTGTSLSTIVGYEVLTGVGLGCILNLMTVLMQAEYLKKPHLIPHATNLFNFWGFVGRIVGLSVATNIFENKLRENLTSIVGLSEAMIDAIKASPDAIWTEVPSDLPDTTLDVYVGALDNVWWLTLAFSLACLVSVLCTRHLNLKTLGDEAAAAREPAEPVTVEATCEYRAAVSDTTCTLPMLR